MATSTRRFGDARGGPASDASVVGAPNTRRTLPSVLVSTAIVAALFTLLFVRDHRFAFIDDRQADGLAKLVDIGRILLSGEWPWLSTHVVNSGGYAIENQYGVFNPVDLGFGILAGKLDDLALASFLQILFHLLVLTAAAAWLGRLVGLSRSWTVAFAVSVGFNPYTVYWGAGWFEAVTSFSWFVLAFAAAVALHLGSRNRHGWVLLVATYLCFQSGWPLAVPLLCLSVGGLVVARVVARRRLPAGRETRSSRSRTRWIAAWFAGGVLTSLVGLYPLFVSFQFADRTSSISNEANANVASLEGLLHFADPSYHGWLDLFTGNELQPLPHYYVAWFALPVLLFWRIPPGLLRPEVRVLRWTSVGLLTVTALASMGPERILVFRFPTRFLQYSGLFLLLTVAVLVAHGHPVLTRARLAVGAGLIAVLAVNGWQADPAGLFRITGLTVASLALGVALLGPRTVRAVVASSSPPSSLPPPPAPPPPAHLAPWWRAPSAGRAAAIGTVLVMVATAWSNPYGRGAQREFPSRQSDLQQLSRADYTLWFGTYPQLVYGTDDPGGTADELSPDVAADFYREYHPSSTGLYAGDRSINGYSPLGHRFLRQHVPLDDQGNFETADAGGFTAVDPETGLTWLELLRVDQVVAVLGAWDDALRPQLDSTWQRVAGTYTASYRHDAYEHPGLLSYASPGVTVDSAEACPLENSRECLDVAESGDTTGRVIFARLWIPGYRATLDGEPIPVTRHEGTLVAVDLPPGASGALVLTYRSPGFLPLAWLALVTVVGLAAAQVIAARRRSRADGSPTASAEVSAQRRDPDAGTSEASDPATAPGPAAPT